MTEYFVAWWNVENLFDIENSSQRPAWLQKKLENELDGWDHTILDTKISQLSKVIKEMNGGAGPDVLGVCEVENRPVMVKLVDSLSSLNRNYQIAHHDTSDNRGIDVAFIYDGDKFGFERQFNHVILKRSATRDLFQVNLKINSSTRDLVLIGNHWPSRRGGELQSEPFRMMAGETLSYFNERIFDIKGDNVAILVMGDFNDEPHDRSLTEYALSSRSQTKVKNSRIPRLFNLMWTLMGTGIATYYYNNFPNMLDQFMTSKGFLQDAAPITIRADSVQIIRTPEMMTDDQYHIPKRFGRPSATMDNTGFSDHFPISLVLQDR